MVNETYVRPVKMKCVHCGKDIKGYMDENGLIKMTCDRCGTITVSKQMSRRHVQIDVYGPPKQVLLNN